MRLLQNSKFTGPALLLLLALNTTLLVLLLFRHPGPPPPFPPGGHHGPRDFLVRELKMDEQQEKAYDALIKTHRAAVDHIQDDIRLQRDSLVSLLGNASADQQQIKILSGRIGNDQEQIETITFNHFIEVRKICRAEQQQKFDEIIHEALRMMGPQGPPPK